jgi:hypothetical protein
MIKGQDSNAAGIKDTIEHLKIAPYQEVKRNLDLAARKTRKALGVTLHCKKPLNVIYNGQEKK